MFNFSSRKIANRMADKSIIQKEDIDLYEYGIDQTLKYSVLFFLGLLLSIVLNEILYFFYFIFLLISTRSYLGGIHLKNEKLCIIVSYLFFVAVLGTSHVLSNISLNKNILVCVNMVQIATAFFSRVRTHENRKLSNSDVLLYKRKSNQLLLAQVMVLLICWKLNYNKPLNVSTCYYFYYQLSRLIQI